MCRNKTSNFILVILLATGVSFLSGCDALIDAQLERRSPSIIPLPKEYKLRIVSFSHFDINYIELNKETVVEINIERIGWNKDIICYVYNHVFRDTKGFGYINVKTGKVTNIDSENDVVTIPEKFSKIKYYTPKELYLEKEKKLNGE